MENPLQLHLTNSRPEAFDLALKQMHAVGFEALVLSFGSGFRCVRVRVRVMG